MQIVKCFCENIPLTEPLFDRIPTYSSFLTDDIYVDDRPIKDNWDLYLALREAQRNMETVIKQTNRYKYIRETQLKACKAIFANLQKIACDYAGELQKVAEGNETPKTI